MEYWKNLPNNLKSYVDASSSKKTMTLEMFLPDLFEIEFKKSKYFPSEIYKPSQNGKAYDWNKENISKLSFYFAINSSKFQW